MAACRTLCGFWIIMRSLPLERGNRDHIYKEMILSQAKHENPLEGVPTQFWRRLDDGRLQCDVCPRECKLQEGQRGLCFVRGRAADKVVLTTYGRSSGFCIDPIEKKPLNHFLPGTPVL